MTSLQCSVSNFSFVKSQVGSLVDIYLPKKVENHTNFGLGSIRRLKITVPF